MKVEVALFVGVGVKVNVEVQALQGLLVGVEVAVKVKVGVWLLVKVRVGLFVGVAVKLLVAVEVGVKVKVEVQALQGLLVAVKVAVGTPGTTVGVDETGVVKVLTQAGKNKTQLNKEAARTNVLKPLINYTSPKMVALYKSAKGWLKYSK